MESLVARIKQDGTVLGEDILKVDSFLTHQVDPKLMREIGRVFAEKFKTVGLTKIVTIEASGNVPAAYVAEELGIPMIFAKKAKNAYLACINLLNSSKVTVFSFKFTIVLYF